MNTTDPHHLNPDVPLEMLVTLADLAYRQAHNFSLYRLADDHDNTHAWQLVANIDKALPFDHAIRYTSLPGENVATHVTHHGVDVLADEIHRELRTRPLSPIELNTQTNPIVNDDVTDALNRHGIPLTKLGAWWISAAEHGWSIHHELLDPEHSPLTNPTMMFSIWRERPGRDRYQSFEIILDHDGESSRVKRVLGPNDHNPLKPVPYDLREVIATTTATA